MNISDIAQHLANRAVRGPRPVDAKSQSLIDEVLCVGLAAEISKADDLDRLERIIAQAFRYERLRRRHRLVSQALDQKTETAAVVPITGSSGAGDPANPPARISGADK